MEVISCPDFWLQPKWIPFFMIRTLFLSDCNGTWTLNHLVGKRTFNYLAKGPVWLNGWAFVCELSGCGFWSRWNNLNFRYHACFVQGVPLHSGNVDSLSTCMCRDKNTQFLFLSVNYKLKCNFHENQKNEWQNCSFGS